MFGNTFCFIPGDIQFYNIQILFTFKSVFFFKTEMRKNSTINNNELKVFTVFLVFFVLMAYQHSCCLMPNPSMKKESGSTT